MKKNEFIKQIRQKYKMSQKKFADYLEVSKSLIEKVEMGKIPATPENKYVKAVCALEGLDNEIFKFDEITNEILREYELTKFSKAFRKFLYFYYGGFYSKDYIENFVLTYSNYIDETVINSEVEDFAIAGEFYGGSWTYYLISNFPKEILYNGIENLIIPKNKQRIDNVLLQFFEIISILTINNMHDNIHFSLFNFTDQITEYFDFIKNISNFEYISENFKIFHCDSINRFLILEKLSQYSETDTILSIEMIKKLKKLKEMEKIKEMENLEKALNIVNETLLNNPEKIFNSNANNSHKLQNNQSTDPKDKQICELLQYAPPAFKDKIIERLLQYKKDIEEL